MPEDELSAAFADEAARGVGVFVDYVWGRPAELLISTLVKSDLGGAASARAVRLISVGEMAGRSIDLPSAALRGSRLEILGSGTANFPPVDQMQNIVSDILRRAADGQLTAMVERVPIAGVERAWSLPSGDQCPALMI